MSFEYSKELIENAFTYKAYRKYINNGLLTVPTSEQEEKFRPYTEKNVTIMNRLDTCYQVTSDLKKSLLNAPATVWLVLTEGWCGDAAYNVPMLAAIEKTLPEKVKLRLLLRDQNTDLMDAHLTDGGRSIPKLIVLNENMQELGTWGPRPQELQSLMKIWKSEGLTLKDLIPKVNDWYENDNTLSLQQELKVLIEGYSKKQ